MNCSRPAYTNVSYGNNGASYSSELNFNNYSVGSNFSSASSSFYINTGATGLLTIVDEGYAGDMFTISNRLGGPAILSADGTSDAAGRTSTVSTVSNGAIFASNFTDALSNPAFSRGLWTLGAGSYGLMFNLFQLSSLTGSDNHKLFLSLSVTPVVATVPVPAAIWLFTSGFGLLGLGALRKKLMQA